jgi:septal ring factor EnvC (AmiA/AmiB activator)
MGERQLPIQMVRDRLTGLLADWGAELSMVLKELEEQRARLAELEGKNSDVEALRKRIEGQESLIETLKADAEDASKLRKEARGKDLDVERLTSELESKKELIRALRRDAEGADRLKAVARLKDREIERLKAEAVQAAQRANAAVVEAEALRAAEAGHESQESAELEAVRAELEARKTLIKSLRADQERAAALEASLEEKRDVIAQLEASINRHASTIAELKRNADAWKQKYQSLRGGRPGESSVQLQALSDTDIRTIEDIDKTIESKVVENKADATIAIDMRRSLLEARRTAQGHGEK